jgi:hypothetical protein
MSRVLVEGEVTGHAHRLVGEGTLLHSASTDVLYLECEVPAEITHEEHQTITLPAGLYRVTRQREYTPAAPRRVVD